MIDWIAVYYPPRTFSALFYFELAFQTTRISFQNLGMAIGITTSQNINPCFCANLKVLDSGWSQGWRTCHEWTYVLTFDILFLVAGYAFGPVGLQHSAKCCSLWSRRKSNVTAAWILTQNNEQNVRKCRRPWTGYIPFTVAVLHLEFWHGVYSVTSV